MLRLICAGICALLLPQASASTVYRCEDAKGHITYTLHGCPEHAEQKLQEAHNPTPGQGKAVPLGKTGKKRSQAKDKTKSGLQVVATTDTPQSTCGKALSSSERRRAVIRQQIRSGMSQRDVENALGKPDKVTSNNGQTRYHYADEKGNSRQVSFDEAGCVKGKR